MVRCLRSSESFVDGGLFMGAFRLESWQSTLWSFLPAVLRLCDDVLFEIMFSVEKWKSVLSAVT